MPVSIRAKFPTLNPANLNKKNYVAYIGKHLADRLNKSTSKMPIIIPFDQQIEPARKAYLQLKQTVADIDSELKQGHQTVLPNLATQLDNLVNAGLTGYKVDFDRAITGREKVSLIMPDQPSGLSRPGDLNATRYSRKGGKLVFAQLTNGAISVTVHYSYIPELTLDTAPRPLPPEVVKISELTEKRVIEIVAKFFSEIEGNIKQGS
jgi:hypothetical protein